MSEKTEMELMEAAERGLRIVHTWLSVGGWSAPPEGIEKQLGAIRAYVDHLIADRDTWLARFHAVDYERGKLCGELAVADSRREAHGRAAFEAGRELGAAEDFGNAYRLFSYVNYGTWSEQQREGKE